MSYFNFETGKGEQDDYPPEQMVGMQSGSAIEMSDADRCVFAYVYNLSGSHLKERAGRGEGCTI